eukprot:2725366-Pleurochrysis_carterae.AAC.2
MRAPAEQSPSESRRQTCASSLNLAAAPLISPKLASSAVVPPQISLADRSSTRSGQRAALSASSSTCAPLTRSRLSASRS